MSYTNRLKLPLIYSSQAQKEVTHNEALSLLDVLTQTLVKSVNQSEIPDQAATGELYIISQNAEAEFADHPNEIAQKLENGWRFITPIKWMRVTCDVDGRIYKFDGQRWMPEMMITSLLDLQEEDELLEGSYDIQNQLRQELQQERAAQAHKAASEYLINKDSGEYLKVISLNEELELQGPYTETQIKIPHHSIVLAVNVRIIQQIHGTSSFSIGTTASTSRYGSGLGIGQDTTNIGLTDHPLTYWNDESIRLTAADGSFTSGTVQVNVQLLKPHGPWNWE